MTDITNPILSAILAALNEHIDARVKAILESGGFKVKHKHARDYFFG